MTDTQHVSTLDFTDDGRDRYTTLQHMYFPANGRDCLKTSLLQILKILASRRSSQFDANVAR